MIGYRLCDLRFVCIFVNSKKLNMEAAVALPIGFTENAVKEINRLLNEDGFDRSQYLRVGVKGGGCT